MGIIKNPFDLLQDVDSDETSMLLDKIAKHKAEEAAKVIAQVRVEAEKEDSERMASGKYFKKSNFGKETARETSYDRHLGNARGFFGGYQNDDLCTRTVLGLHDGYGTSSIGVDTAPVPQYNGKFGSQNGYNSKRREASRYHNHQKERLIRYDDADDNDVTSDEGSTQSTEPAITEDNVAIPEKQVEENEPQESDPNKGEDQPAEKKDESLVSDAIKDKEADAKLMTLSDYEKIREEKRKSLLANKTIEERKVPVDKAFESMKQLSLKKGNDDEIFTKVASAKAVNQRERDARKVKKTLNDNEVLKETRKIFYHPPRRTQQRSYEGQSAAAAVSDGNQGSARGGYSGGERNPGSAQGRGRGDNDQSFGGRGDNGQSFRGRGDNGQSFRGRGDGSGYRRGSASAKTSSSTPSIESQNDFPPL
ncbi:hypothetical protein ACHQM5_001864 [Ranunculus cassubicifolius]